MVYLDYSATTPIYDEVLETFQKVSKEYIGNVNSLHKLGMKSKELQDRAIEQIARIFHVKPNEIIITSGASESNNTAIKGIAFQYQNRGKKILTTPFEHSSILEPLHYLESLGFQVEFIKLKPDGTIDLEAFQKQITNDTILVTVASVSSELGILQPIEELGSVLKNYPKCFFHVDLTQSVGKINIDLSNVDLASCSAHKFYGPKGVGILIKKENIDLLPLIHGGKSTTPYRSGTPALPLIVSMSKALRMATTDLEEKEKKVQFLNQYLKEHLSKIPYITINSTESSIPHILNFSISGIKPETMVHALEKEEIYISTQSACSTNKNPSLPVMTITNDIERASASLRISISYLTTKEECDFFLNVFEKQVQTLKIK